MIWDIFDNTRGLSDQRTLLQALRKLRDTQKFRSQLLKANFCFLSVYSFIFAFFQETDYLPVTVLIEDINDHHPQFVGAPYRIRVEELTPPGLTVFRGLQALGM